MLDQGLSLLLMLRKILMKFGVSMLKTVKLIFPKVEFGLCLVVVADKSMLKELLL